MTPLFPFLNFHTPPTEGLQYSRVLTPIIHCSRQVFFGTRTGTHDSTTLDTNLGQRPLRYHSLKCWESKQVSEYECHTIQHNEGFWRWTL
ncbi:hypothetical protein TNCV_1604161 [Trichonephila clavipes]|nr:hypothetical protein TNCV_1604161 [Trichonephila clavipes]